MMRWILRRDNRGQQAVGRTRVLGRAWLLGALALVLAGSVIGVYAARNQPASSPPAHARQAAAAVPAAAQATGQHGCMAVLCVTKTASPQTFTRAGEVITFTYVVDTNTIITNFNVYGAGSTGPTTTTLVDPGGPLGLAAFRTQDCSGNGQAAPGLAAATSTATCKVTYTTTAADVARGSLDDADTICATAVGKGIVCAPVVTVPVTNGRAPAISVVTQADASSYAGPEQVIKYTYTVTNDGNVDVNHIVVTDSRHLPVTCPDVPLTAGGQPIICRASYTTDEADASVRRTLSDTATAAGSTAGGLPVDSQPSQPADTTFAAHPDISIEDSADVESFDSAGTTFTYLYDVTNTGNVALHDVEVTDSLGITVVCPGTTLEPQQKFQCAAPYTTTAANVSSGLFSTATVTALTSEASEGTITNDDTTEVPVVHAEELSVEETTGEVTFPGAGVSVPATDIVTNTGDTPVGGLVVKDSSGTVRCPVTSLAPGAREFCPTTLVATAADVARGSLPDAVTVTGAGSQGIETAEGAAQVVGRSSIPGPATSVLSVTG